MSELQRAYVGLCIGLVLGFIFLFSLIISWKG